MEEEGGEAPEVEKVKCLRFAREGDYDLNRELLLLCVVKQSFDLIGSALCLDESSSSPVFSIEQSPSTNKITFNLLTFYNKFHSRMF